MKQRSNIFLLMVLMTFAACHKQLNVFPTTQEVDGKVIVDTKSAKTALNGVYYQFANAGFDYNQKPSIKWTDINEVIPSELSGMMTYPYGGIAFADHSYTPSFYGVSDLFDYGYKVVNAANGFLKNIAPVAKIAANNKKEMIAEAKFLRAFANAKLLFYYGQYDDVTSKYGVPLRKEFVTSKNLPVARNTVKETYDYILADLDDAIAGMLNRNTQNYYANVWAAKLLKARVLMVRGSSGDYTNVITLCKDIIANSGFSLEGNTKDIFLSKGLSSNEVILGIKPYTNDIYKYNVYLYYNGAVGSPLMDSLFANDPRKTNTYFATPDDEMYIFTKYFSGADPTNPSPTPTSNDGYAMRLTEAYLLQAEAIAASGGDLNEAKGLLKTVMQHAGFTQFTAIDAANTPEKLRALIIIEEMKNFVGEAGQDWLAVRRLPFATLQKLIPTIKSKTQLLLPIPQDEMKRNTALKGMQNPGYAGE